MAELIRAAQVGVGDQVDRSHRPLRLTHRGEVVVGLKRLPDIGRGHPQRGESLGLQPDPHGVDTGAEDVGALDAWNRRELGLDDACQEIGDLVGFHVGCCKAEIHGGPEFIRVFEFDDRVFGLGREVVADLRELRLNLGQGGVGIVVEFEVNRDRADPLTAGTLDVIDPLGGCDDPFQRCGKVPAHEIGIGTDVGGRHLDHRDVAAGILPHVQHADRLDTGQQDDQVDHKRQHGALDKEIGQLHADGFLEKKGVSEAVLSCPAVSEPGRCQVGRNRSLSPLLLGEA